MTDVELIQKYLKGNSASFNTLAWRWQQRLYNFILRYTGDRDEANDLCQLALIKVYRNLPQLRDPEKFSSWVYQLTLNVCRDEFKKNRRRQHHVTSSLEEQNLAPTNHSVSGFQPSTEEEVYRSNLRETLNKALQTLSEEQRLVVIMKNYQGMTFGEIALALDISENTAKSRLYYGLTNLRKVFDKWNIPKESISHEV